MIDISSLIKNYIDFNDAKMFHRNVDKKVQKYYHKYRNEINSSRDKYYMIDDPVKKKEYLVKNNLLRRFFTMNYLKEYLEEKKYNLLNDISSCKINGKIVLVSDNENEEIFLQDLETNKKIYLNKENEDFQKYIIGKLIKANSYIGEVDINDIEFIKNIIYDFKYFKESIINSNKLIYNEYINTKNHDKELEKEMKNKSYLDYALKLEKENEQRNKNSEEYLINNYIIKIIRERNIDQIYNDANENKELVLKAYEKLSTYDDKLKLNIHIRTSSQCINEKLYQRRKSMEKPNA